MIRLQLDLWVRCYPILFYNPSISPSHHTLNSRDIFDLVFPIDNRELSGGWRQDLLPRFCLLRHSESSRSENATKFHKNSQNIDFDSDR
jgi:hypothetical protein